MVWCEQPIHGPRIAIKVFFCNKDMMDNQKQSTQINKVCRLNAPPLAAQIILSKR